ncbi:zinc finger and BTB domain-containing protein 24 [Solenopsis invicta]|uniref:zinc finger and BTB domain-containing protein 24 n=1 Tax=Solenopsis invicta TaxID=13686 RepID=UPI0001FEA3B5|nr:zinc finger and BTB domain-containing protein 24 [Solenopsis invicta]
MRRRNLKTDKMLKLDEIEGENATRVARKRTRKATEEKKSKGRRKSRHASGSGRKLRSNAVEAAVVPRKVEPAEEETPLDLLYLTKDPSGVSCKIEPSVSNENNYILMPPLETLEDAGMRMEELLEQSMHKISKSQKNGRWKHSYNKMVYLRKCVANSDQSMQDEMSSQSTSEEHERLPRIEDIAYENSERIKRDKKWTKKVNPLSLHYTDKKRPYLKCPACGATFFSPNTYQRHLLSHLHPTEENSYTCNFCNYTNVEPGMLFAHLTKHQNQCESCNETLLRKDNYDKHYQCSLKMLDFGLKRDHHGMFTCAVCELMFDLVTQLEKHWFKHTCKKQKSYQCNECSGLYENAETLKNHKCLKCPICGEVYENLHRLKVHTIWMKHKLTCPICSYEFILSMDHEKHMALHRKVYQPMKDYMHCLRAADGKTYQCNLCDKIFYALSALRTHLTEEHVGSVKVEKEEIIADSSYELKGDTINIVVVPDFKDTGNYYENEMDSLQMETDLYDPS